LWHSGPLCAENRKVATHNDRTEESPSIPILGSAEDADWAEKIYPSPMNRFVVAYHSNPPYSLSNDVAPDKPVNRSGTNDRCLNPTTALKILGGNRGTGRRTILRKHRIACP
jgi:hypothetical protein